MHRQMALVSLSLFSGLILVLTILLVLTGPPDTVQADLGVLYVAPGSDCGGNSPCYATIQAAVDVASNGDTIKVAQGVYTGSGFQVIYINRAITLTGGYAITDWTHSYPITRPTVVDAGGIADRRGVYIDGTGATSITLAGLTVQRGYIQDANGGGLYILGGEVILRECRVLSSTATGNSQGGGVYASNSIINLISNTIQGNSARYGGGINIAGGTATLVRNTIQDNPGAQGIHVRTGTATLIDNAIQGEADFALEVDFYGIATLISNTIQNDRGIGLLIDNNSTVTLISNTIRNSGSGGVCVRSDSIVTLTSNTIQSNSRYGASLYASTFTLRNNTIISNTVDPYHDPLGGGVLIESGTGSLSNNVIHGNIAGQYGGGVYVEDSTVTLDGNIVQSNTAEQQGGGIYVGSGIVVLHRNTIQQNTASQYGGGIAVAGGTTNAQNDIIANNTSPWEAIYLSGGSLNARHWTLANNGNYGLRSNGGSVILTNTIVAFHTLGGFSGINITADHTLFYNSGTPCGDGAFCTNNLTDNPNFLNPTAGDYHIGPGSAAIDQGVDSGVTTDIDGEPRSDGYPDIGADELVGALAVIKLAYPVRVQSGSPLTYTIRVTNTGFVTLTATITDTLPEHITLGETSAGTLILPGEVVTWTPVSIAPEEVWTDTVVVTVETGYSGPLVNVVEVTTEEGATGRYVHALAPGLEVTKQAHAATVKPGDQLTYTITVTNTGNFDLHATIADTLPNHVTTAQPLMWTSQLIPAPDGIWTKTVVVTVETGYVGPLINVVQVTTVEGVTGTYTQTSTALSTLSNRAPHTPTHPIPADGANNVPVTQTLSWQGGDPDNDPVMYTVGIGASGYPPAVRTTTLTSSVPSLITSTAYYWFVIATDGISTSFGPAWSFATAITVPLNRAPHTPSSPIPPDGSSNVPLTQTLHWLGGDPDDDPVTYTVAFGPSDPPPFAMTTALTSYTPTDLVANTTYYWSIAVTDGISTVVGPTWHFNTVAVEYVYLPLVVRDYIPGTGPTNHRPNLPSNPAPPDEATNQPITVTLSWTGGDPDGDAVTYEVHFGPGTARLMACNDVTNTICDPGTLSHNTEYSWQVVATDKHGATRMGPVWHFTSTSPTVQLLHNPGYDNGLWYEFHKRHDPAYPVGVWVPDGDWYEPPDRWPEYGDVQDWRLWFLYGTDLVDCDRDVNNVHSAPESVRIWTPTNSGDQVAGLYQLIENTTPCFTYKFQMYSHSRQNEDSDRLNALKVGIEQKGWLLNPDHAPFVHEWPTTMVWGTSRRYDSDFGPLEVTAEALDTQITVFTYADAEGGSSHKIHWDTGSLQEIPLTELISDPENPGGDDSGISFGPTVLPADTSARVEWNTSGMAVSQVYYREISGTSTLVSPPGSPVLPIHTSQLLFVSQPLGEWLSTPVDTTPKTGHLVIISDLLPGRTFEYYVASRGVSGDACVNWVSEKKEFTTDTTQ